LRRHSDTVLLRKTWGDAIHAVFRTASAAAKAALEMNAATARLAEELEFGRRLAFRIAVHFGTADHNFDPIEEAPTFFGPQLSFAARIVPVAPPGGVYVTEPCAAQLSLEGASDIDCTYIGTTSLAKGYGRVRLLTLSSRT
jgi:adenylate cyclase